MVRKRFSSTNSAKPNNNLGTDSNTSKSRSNSQSRSSVKNESKPINASNNGVKYRNREQREYNKKHPPMPARLNKRLRRLEREKYVQSIAPHTRPENTTAQESLTTDWSILQTAMNDDGEPISPGAQQKRRRDSSTNSNTHTDGKKAKIESADSDSDYVEAEDDLDAIIKSININDKAGKTKAGSKLAWFKNVDPFLVDDDANDCEKVSQDSDVEESENEEAVEVDMDQEDNFIATKETMMAQSERMKEKKRVEQLSENAVALDCEMVGVGPAGETSALARVSIVDSKGDVLYDKHVLPDEPVTDYRTQYSGIRAADLKDAPPFKVVQAEVAALIKRRLLVGHALKNDLQVLQLTHPVQLIRDTSLYRPFCEHYRRASPSLKNLSRDFLGVSIQEGEHDSVTDARVAMRLYTLNRVKWERNVQNGTKGRLNKSMLAKHKRGGKSGPRRRGYQQARKKKHKIGKTSYGKSR